MRLSDRKPGDARRPGGRGGAAFLLLALLLQVGCAGGPRDVSAAPVVIPRANPGAPTGGEEEEARPTMDLAEARRLLGRAEALARAQDYDMALSVLRELAEGHPPPALLDDFQRLRLEVKRHLLQSVWVDAFVVLDDARVTLGDPITGELVLANVGTEPLIIPALVPLDTARGTAPDRRVRSATGLSRTSILQELSLTEFHAGGLITTERETRSFLLAEDIVLKPGERKTWPLHLDTMLYHPDSVALKEFVFGATLYPASIQIGSDTYAGTLVFKPAVCHVFPRNWRHLLRDPLRRLGEAVEKNSPVHIPLAAALVPPEERSRAIGLLAQALSGGGGGARPGPTRVAACVALRILTGFELPPDPEAWLDRLRMTAGSEQESSTRK